MTIHSHREGYLISGASANGIGSALDLRAAPPHGYLYYFASAASAIFGLEASHDKTAWVPINSITASGNATGTGQYSAGYYPYLRARMTAYSGSNTTAQLWVYYAAGIAGGGL
jgi:hypothetical protein